MKLFEIHVSITVRIIYYTDPDTYYSTSSVVRFGTLYKWYGSLCEHCHIDRLTSPMTSDIETVIEEVKKNEYTPHNLLLGVHEDFKYADEIQTSDFK